MDDAPEPTTVAQSRHCNACGAVEKRRLAAREAAFEAGRRWTEGSCPRCGASSWGIRAYDLPPLTPEIFGRWLAGESLTAERKAEPRFLAGLAEAAGASGFRLLVEALVDPRVPEAAKSAVALAILGAAERALDYDPESEFTYRLEQEALAQSLRKELRGKQSLLATFGSGAREGTLRSVLSWLGMP